MPQIKEHRTEEQSAELIRLVIVDDHEGVRAGLSSVLAAEEGITVVGTAASRREAKVLVPYISPSVAVLDENLPDGSGIQLCQELREFMPGLGCVIHTSSLTDELIARAMQAGATQVVAKSLAGNALLYAIRAATDVTEAS